MKNFHSHEIESQEVTLKITAHKFFSCSKLKFTLLCSFKKKIRFPVSLLVISPFNVEKILITLKFYTTYETCRCGQKVWGWILYVFKLNPLSRRGCCMGQRKWVLRNCSHFKSRSKPHVSAILFIFLHKVNHFFCNNFWWVLPSI